jgi:hypothetical protein
MAEKTWRAGDEFIKGLGLDGTIEFSLEEKIQAPDGKMKGINEFPRNPQEKTMLMQEIFKIGQGQQQKTGVFPDAAMNFIVEHGAEGRSGQMKREVGKILETTQRMHEDPIGMKSALTKYEGQTTPYKTPLFEHPLKTLATGPIIAASQWIAGDMEGDLPGNLNDIVDDAIVFAKRRLPTDPQNTGRLTTMIAADVGLLLALRKARISPDKIGTYKSFLGNKVMQGINIANKNPVIGGAAVLGVTSGTASLGWDLAYNWANRSYRDNHPIQFERKENGEFKLDKKGNKIPLQPAITEEVLAALDQAQFEAMFSAGTAGLIGAGAKFWRSFLRGSTGIKPGDMTSDQIAKLAAEYNVPMSIIAASPRDWVKGYSTVIGVFPGVGGPLRKSQDVTRQALYDELEKTFTQLSPYQLTLDTIQSLSKDAYKAFKTNLESFAGTKAVLYESFDDIASEITEPFVPTNSLKKYLDNFAAKADRTVVPLEGGADVGNRYVNSVDEAFNLIGAGAGDANTATQAILALRKMPEHLTMKEFRRLEEIINNKIKTLDATTDTRTPVSSILHNVKKNMEWDLNDLKSWKPMSGKNQINAEVGKQRLAFANDFFSSNKDDFASYFEPGGGTTRVGKFIETKVDPNVMKAKAPKAPGEIQIDEIFDFIMDSKTIQTSLLAQEEMLRQFGPETFNKLARGWMDKQLSKHITIYNVPVAQPGKAAQNIAAGKSVPPTQGTDLGLREASMWDVRPSVSAGIPIIDHEGLRAALGMVNAPKIGGLEARSNTVAIQNLFKNMGKDGTLAYQRLGDLLTLAERVNSFDISDVSKFVQRRGVMAGPKALAGAATVGMGFANPLGALGLILLTRGLSKYMASPKAYKNMMRVLDDNLSPAIRRDAIIDTVRLIDDQVSAFDTATGEVAPSPVMIEGTDQRFIVRGEPKFEKRRREAQKKILGIEKHYGKKIEAITIPEIIDYFVENTHLQPGAAHATTVQLGLDQRGNVVENSRMTNSDSSKFDQQNKLLKSEAYGVDDLSKAIHGENEGEKMAAYAKAMATEQGLGGAKAAVMPGAQQITQRPINPRARGGGGFRETATALNKPNPFLQGMGNVMNFMGGNTKNQLANREAMKNSYFGQGQQWLSNQMPWNRNKLNQQQQMAMASGNLNAALAARVPTRRFKGGGLADLHRK